MAASLDLPRDSSTTAVFQAMFALQEASWHEIDVDLSETGCNMEIVRLENERSKFAVHLMLRGRTDGGLDGDFLYSTDLFTRDTAERMARGYEMLYHAACEHPNGIPISRLSILDEAQQCALMNSANIVTDFPSPRRVDAWVRDAAKQYPDNIALIDADGNSCSYQVLQQRTDELAWFLAEEMGVKEGSTVGMIFDRSIEMFVTILGVLKSGATYVPVDGAKTPAPRISFMLSDTEVKLLIVHDQYATMTQNDVDLDDDVRVVRWSELKASLVPALQRNPSFVPPVVNSENVDALACILYTSGTTGAPKVSRCLNLLILLLIHFQPGCDDCPQQRVEFDWMVDSVYFDDLRGQDVAVFVILVRDVPSSDISMLKLWRIACTSHSELSRFWRSY